MKRYIATIDPDDAREGEVRLGATEDDYTGYWGGGQLIFKWECPRNNERCGRPPAKIERIVELANKALDA